MQNSNLEQSLAFAELVADGLKGGPISTGRGIWQDPFLVLWRTSMPAVLIELGFISNSSDLAVLKKDSERDKLATRLCNAFKKYKAAYDGTMVLDVEIEDQPAKAEPEKKDTMKEETKKEEVRKEDAPEQAAVAGVRYGVQIFAGSARLGKKDKAFMGYEPFIYDTGKVFKYIICVGDDISAVRKKLPEIRKKYPDAFVVKIEADRVSIAK